MSVKKVNGGYVIDFTLNHERFRETIPAPHNVKALRRIEDQEKIYRMAISLNDKSIANHFPNSKIIQKAFDTGCNFTIHDYSKIWFQRRQRNWTYSTRRGYSEKYKNHIFNNWGNIKLNEFESCAFSDWAARTTLSAKTVNEVRNIINQIFETALVDKIIIENPIRYVKKFKHVVTEPNPFKPIEIESILNCLVTPHRQFFQFAFFSGMRTGELLGLRWQDVDMEKCVIHVRLSIVHGFEKEPKTKGSLRTLDLHPRAIDALREIRRSDYYDPHRVFIDPDTMKTYSYADKLRKYVWKPALLKASITYRKPYITRHTYASLMLSQGKPAIWVARQLGHSDLSMLTKTYGRWINLT